MYEHEFSFGRKKGYFDKYGLVILQCTSEAETIKKLNLIFAISLIKGFPVLSVRNTEIIHSKIYEDREVLGQPLGGLKWHISHTKRFTPTNFQGQRKKGISLEKMYEIIQDFEKALDNQNLSNSLLSLIESYTHLHNKEYSQSYLYSWLIVEQYIKNRFEEIINQKNMSTERKGKFKDPDRWSSDIKIEFLNLYGSISDEEYEKLSKCNKKRNKFVHNGLQINKELAESLYDLSFKILETELIKKEEKIN
ncbi:hypothetical protein F1737_00055 [Methanoplanus sp. FWC-SCC4]|uniref:Uncharacterized protein n=1 Tax=Methanochimaera problematica TaxID=2609417 RepID=A0AA97I235_9EURY|nr:hypothetical protein [Methanoplanus sp. FWC-SCC4]WOF15178.1 hypothetical protein F1737_00055 [Methanoplanus sp. FWC-SCC4]